MKTLVIRGHTMFRDPFRGELRFVPRVNDGMLSPSGKALAAAGPPQAPAEAVSGGGG